MGHQEATDAERTIHCTRKIVVTREMCIEKKGVWIDTEEN